jgi:hypothetical protein
MPGPSRLNQAPGDVELWRQWARQRYANFTPQVAQRLEEQREVFGREADFVTSEGLYAYFGVGDVGKRRVRALTNLVAIGVHPVLAVMLVLYRARRLQSPSGSGGTRRKQGYLLTWPLRHYVFWLNKWKIKPLDNQLADLLPRGPAEIRAVCAMQWPALMAQASRECQQLEAEFGRAELVQHWHVNAWPALLPTTYAEVLAWLQTTWDRQWTVVNTLPHNWLADDPGRKLDRAARQMLAKARLAGRWQRGMEHLILFGRPEAFWEEMVLGQVTRIQRWAGSPIADAVASVQADLGFPLPRDEGAAAGRLLRDLVGATELASGLREPAGLGRHGHSLLVLFRDLRADQIFASLRRRRMSLQARYTETLMQMDTEALQAQQQGLLSKAMYDQLIDRFGPVALSRALLRIKKTLPAHFDGRPLSHQVLNELVSKQRAARDERIELQPRLQRFD